jgi:CHU_C Type IX secretion signal domain
LFNPLPNGKEYVEIYNRLQKIIDLNKVYIANRNSAGIISNIKHVTDENILLFPGEFMVLSTDPEAVKNQYLTQNPDAFLKVNSMPSTPNDKGHVILLNQQGLIIDEVAYSEKWHFPLIQNPKGVSLERLDYNGPSAQSNFHSAASSVGYGTPGYKNSQSAQEDNIRTGITVTPGIFSPDNDGIDDFVVISYNFPSEGNITNISIFDISGKLIRTLQNNALSGSRGTYKWDGLDDKNRTLPQGIYIIFTDTFNKNGKKKQYKNTVVLARRY